MYTMSQKKMLLLCLAINVDIRESILVSFSRIATQKVSGQKILCFPTSPN